MLRRSRWKATTFAAALVVVVSVSVLLSIRSAEPDASASSTFGVYVEPPDTPDDVRLDIDSVTLEQNQLKVVSSVEALVTEVAESHPQSIWINRLIAESVPRAWLRDLSKQGTVIVGINMTRRELGTLLGSSDFGGSPDWRPQEVPVFVIYYERLDVPFTNEQGEPATFGSKGWFNDSYDPQRPDRLFSLVHEAIRNTQLASPNVQPRSP